MFKIKLSVLTLLLFIFASTTLASGESVSIDFHDTTVCTPGSWTDGITTHVNGTEALFVRFTLRNQTRGTSNSLVFDIFPSGTWGYSTEIPVSTVEDDTMQIMAELLDFWENVLVSDTFTYQCKPFVVDPPPDDDDDPPPDDDDLPLDDDDPQLEIVDDPQPAFYDGRINSWDTGNPVVLFPFADGNSLGLNIYSADGTGLILSIPASAIDAVAECPDSNSLIYSDSASGISLWRLPQRSDGTCSFQLNAPATEAGKTYSIIFNGMFSGTYYESWEE